MLLYIVKEGDFMGTSTRRTNDRVNKILKSNNKSINDINLNKLISDVLFPKRNSSKIKSDIVNSTCSVSFTNTIKKIIALSNNISKSGIGTFGISNFNNLLYQEKVELISSEICYDEDPIIKQSIVEILQSKDLEAYLIDSYQFIKDFLIEYYTEKLEAHMFEELATNVENFDDEKCKNSISNLVKIQVEKIFNYSTYHQLVINVNDEVKATNIIRNISNFILKELKA